MDEEENVFRFPVISNGEEGAEVNQSIPQNDYTVVDIDDIAFDVTGFLIFTPSHLAIMKDTEKGAIPLLVMPIARLKVAALAEIFDDE